MVAVSSSHARPLWLALLAALLGGSGAGAVAKLADESTLPGVGMIGTHFGVWIVVVAIIAAWSHSWWRAVLCSVAFLLAMVGVYYIVQMWLFGFFSTRLLLAWAAFALFLAPPFAGLVWHARRTGWRAALGAALPIGLLLHEAYSLRFRLGLNNDYPVLFVFDLVCAVALFLILPKNGMQRLRVLALTLVVIVGARVLLEYVLAVVGGYM